MAVKIRLMRVGKTKQPTYRVVVADARSPRDGRYIEIVGSYAPRSEPRVFTVNEERVLSWLGNGAQPTGQVHRLLESSGLWERYESDRRRPSARLRTKTASVKGTAVARAAREAAARREAEAATQAEAAAQAEAKARADADAKSAAEAAAASEAADAPAPSDDDAAPSAEAVEAAAE